MGGKGSGAYQRRPKVPAQAIGDIAAAAARVALGGGGAGEIAQAATGGELPAVAALFPEMAPEEALTIDNVLVNRVGPVVEGVIGELQADEGAEDIGRKWGGGKYRLSARTEGKRNIRGGFRTIEIAGEPRLKSKSAEQEYRRQMGEPANGAAAGGAGSMDVWALMARQEDRARQDHERRMAEEDARHRRDMERIRAESQEREKAWKLEEERREKDRKLEDERRARERQERDERERRQAEEARQRDREYYSALLKMQKEGHTDPMASLNAGINLALKLKGDDGPGDPLTALVSGLPAIAEMVRGAGGAMAAAGAAAAPSQALPAAAPVPRPAPAAQAAPQGQAGQPPPRKRDPKGVTLEGDLALKARRAIGRLQALGVNPEQAIADVLDRFAALEGPPPEKKPSAEPEKQEQPAPAAVSDAASSETNPPEAATQAG